MGKGELFGFGSGEAGKRRRRGREGSGKCLNSFSNDLAADGGLLLTEGAI